MSDVALLVLAETLVGVDEEKIGVLKGGIVGFANYVRARSDAVSLANSYGTADLRSTSPGKRKVCARETVARKEFCF